MIFVHVMIAFSSGGKRGAANPTGKLVLVVLGYEHAGRVRRSVVGGRRRGRGRGVVVVVAIGAGGGGGDGGGIGRRCRVVGGGEWDWI